MGTSSQRPQIFTIPPERGFSDDLAFGLLQAAKGQGDLALARTLVLLPNRRAVRALTEAFVRLSDGKALLLPRMAPVGDVDPDEAFGNFAQGLEGAAEFAPAIEPLARQVALMRLLQPGGRGAAASFALAGQLAAALDTLEVEGKRAADLKSIVPAEDLQEHWNTSLRVLDVVMQQWPLLLQSRGEQDATRRRTLLLESLSTRWTATPPSGPVVIAGFANAPPAVAALMRVVARLPQGQVVLPGLDTTLTAETWSAILGEESAPLEIHPHYGFARLLAAMRVAPAEVMDWPHRAQTAGSASARTALVRRAMAPAALTAQWQALELASDALAGVQFLEAASPAEEALAIALAMRQLVQHPGRTAALVTPDRALAKRVRVQLARFQIQVDDSAGEPLASLPPGTLLAALAQGVAERFAPVALLGLLKHPLVRSGDARLPWLSRVRALDRLVLRGLRPAAGLEGVAARIAHRATDAGAKEARLRDREREEVEALLAWWHTDVAPHLKALDALGGQQSLSLETLLVAIRAAAEALAGDTLWSGLAGRALAQRIEALDACRDNLLRVTVLPAEAPELLSTLLADVPVRPAWGQHPQLAIWGPLEARLQQADVLILGGLNEGVWPGTPAPDPWLAPAVRRALDLPGLARRTGLQAHDFVAAMGAPEVLLTRSAREGSAPSVPSRFWQRLRAVAGDAVGTGVLLPEARDLLAVARRLDLPATAVRMQRPAPCPPVTARPKRLSITEVATLKADPFAFYARRIMQLSPLDPLDADPTGGDRGTLVHRILQRWVAEPAVQAADVEALVDAELAKFGDRPEIAALWRGRVLRMVAWAQAEMDKDAAEGWTPEAVEGAGTLDISGVTLRGRADRIDAGPEGLRIVDYKTGAPPQKKKVMAFYDTQLALLALMAEAGAIAGLPKADVVALAYWNVSGGREPGKVQQAIGAKASAADVRAHLEEARADFADLAGRYLLGEQPFRAKLHPVYSRASKDFDQLARLAEWLDR